MFQSGSKMRQLLSALTLSLLVLGLVTGLALTGTQHACCHEVSGASATATACPHTTAVPEVPPCCLKSQDPLVFPATPNSMGLEDLLSAIPDFNVFSDLFSILTTDYQSLQDQAFLKNERHRHLRLSVLLN